VIGVIGGTVSAAARSLGHYISFGVTLVIMIGLVIYVALKRKQRYGRWWQINGPLLLSIFAALFIMADLTRHVLQDLEWWPSGPWPGSSEYRSDCHEETFKCLSPLGWIFTVVLTYLGFGMLVVGTMWNANICDKVQDFRDKWAELRGRKGKINADGQV